MDIFYQVHNHIIIVSTAQ